MYVVIGATGNTGSVVAERLLQSGKKVRVVGRDAKRLERFTRKGAEAFQGDVTDANAMTAAFAGATAGYLMIPPNPAALDVLGLSGKVSHALTEAVRASGLKHAVVLSSYGADKASGTGPVVGLHNLEEELEGISTLNALYLRAGYFMENLLPQAEAIKWMGFMAGPVKADLPLPMIATRDIGEVAAEALLRLDFSGKGHRELQGARDVRYAEVAKIIGPAIGKPDLVYREASAAQLKPALMQMGMSANMIDLLLQMADALNTGYMKMNEPRSASTTMPTTIETFIAEVFVPAFRGHATSA